jgi:hypothetical protein
LLWALAIAISTLFQMIAIYFRAQASMRILMEFQMNVRSTVILMESLTPPRLVPDLPLIATGISCLTIVTLLLVRRTATGTGG